MSGTKTTNMATYKFTRSLHLEGTPYSPDPNISVTMDIKGLDVKEGDPITGNWVHDPAGNTGHENPNGKFEDNVRMIRWTIPKDALIVQDDAPVTMGNGAAKFTINLSLILPIAGALLGVLHARSEKRGIAGVIGYVSVGGLAGYGLASLAGDAIEGFVNKQFKNKGVNITNTPPKI